MVEGARLESVYTGNCIWGSNPHLSATSCVTKVAQLFLFYATKFFTSMKQSRGNKVGMFDSLYGAGDGIRAQKNQTSRLIYFLIYLSHRR